MYFGGRRGYTVTGGDIKWPGLSKVGPRFRRQGINPAVPVKADPFSDCFGLIFHSPPIRKPHWRPGYPPTVSHAALAGRDRKAFEEAYFGGMYQADTCYLPYLEENGKKHRTYLIMILDDYSRMIVGGRIFYQENAYNFQKVLKDAVAAYGIPNKLYVDSGAPYKNRQLDMVCASIGTVLLHTPVRDGASKGKVERNFRTLKERWLYGLDISQIRSLDEFNDLLAAYIRKHNTTEHSTTL